MPMIPEKFGRYEIKSELGRGGMAIVYLARDPRFDRDVAIKVLPREFLFDPQFHVRFEREIKTVAKLEHPAIVPVHDVGEEDGQPYFVMRYMPGGSLSDRLKQGGMSLQDTAHIIERLANGLNYAHNKGVIHRDLKPGNILFDGNDEPFISDFGVAKLSDAATSMTGNGIIGTPAYMSPEQAQSMHIDARSDIYTLGAIIFEMLTGHQPFKADTPMSVLLKHISDPVPEILREHPEFPPELDEVIKKAMNKEPELRHGSAIELARALNKAAFGEEGNFTDVATARPSTPLQDNTPAASMAPTLAPEVKLPVTATSSNNKKWIAIGAGVFTLVICVGLVALILLRPKPIAPPPAPTPTLLPTHTPYPTITVEQPTQTVEQPTQAVTVVDSPTAQPPASSFSVSQWSGSFLEPWGARVGMNLVVLKIKNTSFTGKMSWNFGDCAALMALNGEIITDVSAATEQNRWALHPDFQSGDKGGTWLRWTQTENQGNPKCYVNTGDWWYGHIGSNGHLIAIRFMNDTDPKPATGNLDLTLDK